ncbi:redox-regulated ATPase YchF [Candidatus Micrarchaeota archaeon]|nr:redox-regulated ATPase YchF [Candidatus Micrarchaeota archaeon]MBU1930226.1 redox-regulated ATPase YchF [Candidatus Micrarchaeota archaeon]
MLIGLVGAPSSGKSTFFSAATLIDVPIANYPFTTIEPNKGVGFVRVQCVDKEFNVQCNPRTGYCKNGTRFVPVELIDVAGLVPGAHEGKGRGNAFLSDLSRADVLIHVVDASGSTNEKGEPLPPGSHDPSKDILFLEEEIDYWFLGILQKNWDRIVKKPFESKSALLEGIAQILSGVGATETIIGTVLAKTGLTEKKLGNWSEEDKKNFATTLREVSKPIVIAANKMDIPIAEQNLKKLKEKFPEKPIIPCSGFAELALKKAAKEGFIEYQAGSKEFTEKKELNKKQQTVLNTIRETVLKKFESTGIQDCLDKTVFELLGFIAVFPAGVHKLADAKGNILPDCILMPSNSTTLDFAFKLHTDMGKGFIKAIDVKTKQMVGKEHVLKNRDAIEIIFKK